MSGLGSAYTERTSNTPVRSRSLPRSGYPDMILRPQRGPQNGRPGILPCPPDSDRTTHASTRGRLFLLVHASANRVSTLGERRGSERPRATPTFGTAGWTYGNQSCSEASVRRFPEQCSTRPVGYSPRNATVIGRRAARTAGSRPPMAPRPSAQSRPSRRSSGVTAKSKAIWEKDTLLSVETV